MELESSFEIEGRRREEAGFLEKLSGVRKPFLISYVLRIIPVFIDIVGYILSGILWIKAFIHVKERVFIVAGALILAAGLLYGYQQVSQLFEVFPALSPSMGNVTQEQYIGSLINATEYSIHTYRSPLNLSVNGLLGVGLFFEAIAFIILYRRSSEVFKLRTPIMLIILGLLVLTIIPVSLQTASGLEEFVKELEEYTTGGKVLTQDEINQLLLRYLSILMPLSMIGFLILIVRIITYIFAALAFKDLGKYLKQLKIMYTAPPPPPST